MKRELVDLIPGVTLRVTNAVGPGFEFESPIYCGPKGIRTPDLLIANETRYQLRHRPKRLNYTDAKRS